MLSREYKSLNADIRPDAALTAETKEKMKQLLKEQRKRQAPFRRVLAATSAAAVLMTAVFIPLLSRPGTGGPTGSQPEHTNTAETNDIKKNLILPGQQLPDWYKPGELTVISLKESEQKSAAATVVSGMKAAQTVPIRPLSAGQELKSLMIEVPNGLVSNGISYGNYIGLYTRDNKNPYFTKQNIYYDLSEQTVLCMDDHDEAVSKKSGLLSGTVVYFGSLGSPVYHKSVLQFQNRSTGKVSYYIRNADDSLERLGIPEKGMISAMLSPDMRYVVTLVDVGSMKTEIWLTDLAAEHVTAKNLTLLDGKQYDASEFNVKFSDDGKHLTYMLRDSLGNVPQGKDAQWMLYSLETDTWFQGRGEIVRFVADDAAVLTVTADGAKILETAGGGDVTDTFRLEPWETRRLVAPQRDAKTDSLYELYVTSVFEEEAAPAFLCGNVNGYYISGEYVYAYSTAERLVTCYSLADDKSFSMQPPEEFFTLLSQRNPRNCMVTYYLRPSIDGKQLVIDYSVSDMVYSYSFSSVVESGLALKFWASDSFAGVAEIVEQTAFYSDPAESSGQSVPEVSYPSDVPQNASHVSGTQLTERRLNGAYRFYTGEQFACISVTAENNRIFSIVEDYRDRTFTMYSGGENNPLAEVYIYQDSRGNYPTSFVFRKKLAEDASLDKARKQFRYLKEEPATLDFVMFYKDGKLEPERIYKWQFEQLRKRNPEISLAKTPDKRNGVYYYPCHDTQIVNQIIDRLQRFEYQQKVMYSYEMDSNCNLYHILLSAGGRSAEFEIGYTYQNRPIIGWKGIGAGMEYYCIYPTKAEMDELFALLKPEYEKAESDFEREYGSAPS